jgi:hypothetical protein
MDTTLGAMLVLGGILVGGITIAVVVEMATKEADLTAQMGELNAWYGRFQAILAANSAGQPNPVPA